MKTYVISLVNSPRRKVITERLGSLNISFEFVDAIEKEQVDLEELDRIYDKEACLKRHKRELSVVEIACFLSHKKTWENIKSSDEKALVLEDDALFSDKFKLAYNLFKDVDGFADVVLLGHSKLSRSQEGMFYFHNPIFNKVSHGLLSMGNVFKYWTSGNVGYYLTPKAANILLNKTKVIKCVGDDWGFFSTLGFDVKEIRPFVVWEDFENLPSDIELDRKQNSYRRSSLVDCFFEPIRFLRAICRNVSSIFK